jgi:hypothetical protein
LSTVRSSPLRMLLQTALLRAQLALADGPAWGRFRCPLVPKPRLHLFGFKSSGQVRVHLSHAGRRYALRAGGEVLSEHARGEDRDAVTPRHGASKEICVAEHEPSPPHVGSQPSKSPTRAVTIDVGDNVTQAPSETPPRTATNQLARTQIERRARIARTAGRDPAIQTPTGQEHPQPKHRRRTLQHRSIGAVKRDVFERGLRHRENRAETACAAAYETRRGSPRCTVATWR